MDLLRLQIDLNQDNSINNKDERVNLMFLGGFSIVCEQKTKFITSPGEPTILHSPSPCQYAILNNKHRSLKRMLEITIEEMKKDPKEIYRSIKSNTKYPLIHLAVLTQSTECLTVLLNYLVNIKNLNIITKHEYEEILYMTDVTEKHTALFYSLFHFESFKKLIEISSADPFLESIEGINVHSNRNGNDNNNNEKDRRQVSIFALSFFRYRHSTNAVYNYLEEKMPNELDYVMNNWKIDFRTCQLNEEKGKTFSEILKEDSLILTLEAKNILIKLFAVQSPEIKTIDVTEMPRSSEIEKSKYEQNEQTHEIRCTDCKKELATTTCNCGKYLCDECFAAHECK